MPTTPIYCNWCRERIGTYHDTGSPDGAFTPEGEPPHHLVDHLRVGQVADVAHGVIRAHPCSSCGRNNLLQLPPAAKQQ